MPQQDNGQAAPAPAPVMPQQDNGQTVGVAPAMGPDSSAPSTFMDQVRVADQGGVEGNAQPAPAMPQQDSGQSFGAASAMAQQASGEPLMGSHSFMDHAITSNAGQPIAPTFGATESNFGEDPFAQNNQQQTDSRKSIERENDAGELPKPTRTPPSKPLD